MQDEDLKVIWICNECRANFIFHSDVDDHMSLTDHRKINKYDLLSGRLIEDIDAQ